LVFFSGGLAIATTLKMDFGKNDRTPAHACQNIGKPTADTQTEEVQDRCKETMDIYRVKQSEQQDMIVNI